MAKDEAISVKGAELILENTEEGIHETMIIGEVTQLPNLPEGDYIITINQENCEPYITAIHLGPNTHIKLDVKLTPIKKNTKKKSKRSKTKDDKETTSQGDDKSA